MTDRADTTTQFLTVEEAARKLGQSRLRVREAVARGVLRARRDNEGRLRVDLPAGPRALDGAGTLVPDDVIGFLFDDIEELETTLAERNAQVAALSDLVERQGGALDQAGDALDKAEEDAVRLSQLLDRALAHLESADATRLAEVSERALSKLEETGDRLEASLDQSARFAALLERATALAEAGRDAPGLATATDRAMDLLEDAVARAEAGEAAQARSAQMLDRALAAGERMQTEIDAQAARIEAQDATIEKTISLSERAAALADKASHMPERRGFFRRLFGF